MSQRDEPLIFAPRASRFLAERIAMHAGLPLAELDEKQFENGEYKSTPRVNVSGRRVYVVHSLFADPLQSVHDKLCEMLFLIGAVKDGGASRVTAIAPSLCYSRKDRRIDFQEPVTTRYVASLFEAVGTDEVLTLDVHNRSAFENAFRIPATDLSPLSLYVDYFSRTLADTALTVVSPDIGATKRAEAFRRALVKTMDQDISLAFMVKYREDAMTSTDISVVGDISDRTAIILDDMVSTGTTIARALEACAARGAREIYVAATHGLFANGVNSRLDDPSLTRLIITNTCDPFRLRGTRIADKLTILDASEIFSDRIRNSATITSETTTSERRFP